MSRLHRQNSFGQTERKSTLVISRAMELKILEGESCIPNASPVVLESINRSLESLITTHQGTKPVVYELPEFVKDTIISHCDLSEKELIDKRYGEYFEGYSLANNVQYIPVELECLSNLSEDLCKSILSLFVSIVFEYITDDNNLNHSELIKWGTQFLQRIAKILNLKEEEVAGIIKPVSERLELKHLGMDFDDLVVEKQEHITFIHEHLAPMQENVNDFFNQTIGTYGDEEEEEYEANGFKDGPETPKHDDKHGFDIFGGKDSEEEDAEAEEYFKRNFLPSINKPDYEDRKDREDLQFKDLVCTVFNDGTNSYVPEEQGGDTVVTDLGSAKIEHGQGPRGDDASLSDYNTNMGDDIIEEVDDDLLKDLEKSIFHRAMPPTSDMDTLINDISNLNLPPKKNKSLSSKIFGNISKKINRVFSINSDKSSRASYTSSIPYDTGPYPSQDYLNNLLLIEKSPDIVAVLVRNLVLKFIISGYNDSRVQVMFERFCVLLGVSGTSVLSIENNIVSDLVGILDVNAAKTTTKKMSKRLKILSATLGGTALLALTAGMASPVLAVGIAFLGLSGTGVSSYLSSNEGSTVLKNIFGINVSLTQFKFKKDQLSNFQFIQLNPSSAAYRESTRDAEMNRFASSREPSTRETPREKDDVSNFIGICICVGNNVFLNEIFFFENDSINFNSNETIRHFDSEYIDLWKRQFPVPINDLYLVKWESKMLASLHRMLLKLTTLSIYKKSLELYQTIYQPTFTTGTVPREELENQEDLFVFDEVRDSSGSNRRRMSEGSSGNYYSNPPKEPNGEGSGGEERLQTPREAGDPQTNFYKDFKERSINWPLGLVQLCSNLDNCWLVCRSRAEMCGAQMANAISDKLMTGDRHVSLIGYSMGARAIFYCLLSLYEKNKLHTVKDVVLMGLPSTAGYDEWSKCASVVAGRLINVYNQNDWILAFLYRYTSNYRVAGLAPVIHEKVENFNATNLFSSHVDYLENISKITAYLNVQL